MPKSNSNGAFLLINGGSGKFIRTKNNKSINKDITATLIAPDIVRWLVLVVNDFSRMT
jgi:hypothetical protein